ncbi:MAG: ATP-dependent Clp protease adaptor ClpS [Bacteroidales bacterium]|nr:ATP-dependent Clp protease adaptor ClpS [Bacteroidales bacterium]
MGTERSAGTRSRLRFSPPKQYNVIMHNDDFTTMDFVVMVLMTVFYKDRETATRLMMDVHHSDRATVGTYSLDVAKSKVDKATEMARQEGFPFLMTIEPAEDVLPF